NANLANLVASIDYEFFHEIEVMFLGITHYSINKYSKGSLLANKLLCKLLIQWSTELIFYKNIFAGRATCLSNLFSLQLAQQQ
ncbi:hypothetical protein CEXT_2851, partial [Caerostris extrusa]